jgi:copper resistance protein B
MNRLLLALWMVCAAPVFAQHDSHDMSTMQNATPPEAVPPPAARSGPSHAADTLFDPEAMTKARGQLRAEEGGANTFLFLADRLEAGNGDQGDIYAWDVQGWYGGDLGKFWFKSEGEGDPDGNLGNAEVQLLYGHAITPFFDAQIGVRHDFRPDPERSYLVAGIQGLLPYTFDLEATMFLSEEGDLSGRLEAEYDLRITQRLLLQPRVEVEFAMQDVPSLQVGSGIGSVTGGLRLRYEIRREIAPYVGIVWEQKQGDTAEFARAAGEERTSLAVLVGARFWF